MTDNPLLLLGVGQVGEALAATANGGRKIFGTTRQPFRMFELAELGLEPIVMPLPSAEIIEHVATGSDVVVSFPPDGETDAILAPGCKRAHAIVYVSSTSVYGSYRGQVDDSTPVAENESQTQMRLDAEHAWREAGAIVLRAPGIYGPRNGLHRRLRDGSYKIPGDGSGVLSRIHIDDLVQIVLSALNSGFKSETYVIGDLDPAPQIEVVEWLCRKMNIPLPGHCNIEEVNPTLRGSRSVNAARALSDFNVKLKYPSYKDGFDAVLNEA